MAASAACDCALECNPCDGAPAPCALSEPKGDALPSPLPMPLAPPFAASKAALYDEAGANDGMDCGKNGPLDSGPKEDGELMLEPNDALNGE